MVTILFSGGRNVVKAFKDVVLPLAVSPETNIDILLEADPEICGHHVVACPLSMTCMILMGTSLTLRMVKLLPCLLISVP